MEKENKGSSAGKTPMFFLNDTGSELSSSNSEDEMSHAQYLLQHEETKKGLREKAKRLAE